MGTLKTVPNNQVISLFQAVSDNFDGLPEDREVLKYYRSHLALKPAYSEAPRLGQKIDVGYLDQIADKYPKFKDVIEAIKLRPDDYFPDEIQKKILSMMADQRNFK